MGRFYGREPFRPGHICAQIGAVQAVYWASLLAGFALGCMITTVPFSPFHTFDTSAYDVEAVIGWVSIFSNFVAALALAVGVALLVGRVKKSLDFVTTAYLLHTALSIAISGWPTLFGWWVTFIASYIVSAFLSEHLCLKREMQDISVEDIVEKRRRAEAQLQEGERQYQQRMHANRQRRLQTAGSANVTPVLSDAPSPRAVGGGAAGVGGLQLSESAALDAARSHSAVRNAPLVPLPIPGRPEKSNTVSRWRDAVGIDHFPLRGLFSRRYQELPTADPDVPSTATTTAVHNASSPSDVSIAIPVPGAFVPAPRGSSSSAVPATAAAAAAAATPSVGLDGVPLIVDTTVSQRSPKRMGVAARGASLGIVPLRLPAAPFTPFNARPVSSKPEEAAASSTHNSPPVQAALLFPAVLEPGQPPADVLIPSSASSRSLSIIAETASSVTPSPAAELAMGGRMSAPQSARLPSIRERGQSAAGVSAGQGIHLPAPWSVRSTGSSPAGTVSEGAGATAFALPQAPGSATQRSSEGGLLYTSPIPVGNSAVLVAGMHAVSSFETIGSALTAGSGAASSILDRSASNASIPADAASSWHGVERHMSPHGPPSSVTSSSSLFMSAHPVPGAGSVGRHWAHATSPSEPSSRGTTPHA